MTNAHRYATAQLVIARPSINHIRFMAVNPTWFAVLTMLATAEKLLIYHANNSLSKRNNQKIKKIAFFTK
jgi:hypothetical protein